jgi:F-box-like
MPPCQTMTATFLRQWTAEVNPVDQESVSLESEDNSGITRHPLGVRPSGNALTSEKNLRDSMGFFSLLPEEVLTSLLEWLDEQRLTRLGATCRAFYAYTTNDQVWRDLTLR